MMEGDLLGITPTCEVGHQASNCLSKRCARCGGELTKDEYMRSRKIFCGVPNTVKELDGEKASRIPHSIRNDYSHLFD